MYIAKKTTLQITDDHQDLTIQFLFNCNYITLCMYVELFLIFSNYTCICIEYAYSSYLTFQL